MSHHALRRVAVFAVLGAELLMVACEKGPPTGRPPGEAESACPSDLLGAVGHTCAPDGTTCTGSNGAAFTHLLMCSRGTWVEMEAPPPPPPPPPVPVVPQSVDLSEYDKACRTDVDCELVQASHCARCGCAREPLAVREHERFIAARAAIQCAPVEPSPAAGSGCGGCQGYEAWCDHGSCAARTR